MGRLELRCVHGTEVKLGAPLLSMNSKKIENLSKKIEVKLPLAVYST